MSNYTQSTNFATKDALSPGDPLKIVRGTEINTEFTNIAVAVATKLDTTALAAPGPIGATTPSTINATTVTASGNVQMASANGGQLAGLRNRIINGNISVNQRGVSAGAITGTVAYTADRWASFATGTPSGTLTMGQTTYALGGGSSNTLLRIARTSGTYVGSLVAAQAFETLNSYGLAGQTVCISFKARAGSAYLGASLPSVFIKTGTGVDQSTSLMISNSWTTAASTTVTLTGTLGTSFSTFYGTATIPALTTQVGVQIVSVYASGTGTANDYLDITDVQLEVGPVATPFEQRPIGMELALCQRYFQVVSGVTFYGFQSNASSGFRNVYITWISTLRSSTPSVNVITSTGGTLVVLASNQFGASFNVNIGNTTSDVSLNSYNASAEL